MLRHAGVTTLLMLACCTASAGEPLPGTGCSVPAFESRAAPTVDACTLMLDRTDLADGERAEALKIRGRALHRVGRLDDAIRDYESALRLAPKDPELHLRRGWTAYDKREFWRVLDHAAR